MRVFLSWSGRRSHEVADALNVWLKKVIQSADPWISSDMERGVKWLAEIGKTLDTHSIGIFCVTPGNKEAPWLIFEAGAMSKHLGDEGRVIPYLLDFRSPSDLKEPLGQFNACLADEAGTWQLVKTLNVHAEYKQDEPDLRETFDLWWPKLRHQLEAIRTSLKQQPQEARRPDSEKLDELLELVRSSVRSEASTQVNLQELGRRMRLIEALSDSTSLRYGSAREAVDQARRVTAVEIEEQTAASVLSRINEKYGLPPEAIDLRFDPFIGSKKVVLRAAAGIDEDTLQRVADQLRMELPGRGISAEHMVVERPMTTKERREALRREKIEAEARYEAALEHEDDDNPPRDHD